MTPARLFCMFRRQESGNIAIVGAIVIAMVIASAGVGVDFMRLAKERTAMLEAADSAALIAAKLHRAPEGERIKAATAILKQNYSLRPGEAEPKIEIKFDSDKVTVTAVRDVPTTLLAIVGTRSMKASVTSVAARGVSSPVCILALDTDLPNGFEVYGNAALIAN